MTANEETWTSKQIVRILIERYTMSRQASNWIVLPELRIGTGFGKDAEQRLDLWAINVWPSEHLRRIAFEIKVSRPDFLAELRQPAKRRRALLLSNEFYFAAPAGLIAVSELPLEAGLMEITKDGYAHAKVAAPWRDTPAPSWRFFAAVARRLSADARNIRERTADLQN